jgi:DNA-binding beta-propeller fold protein YncE
LASHLPIFQGCTSRTLNAQSDAASAADLVIGQRGLADGRFQKPRVVAISPADEIYTIDKTSRVQVFDTAGKFLRGWKTPQGNNGKPTGATFDVSTDQLLVADTHYFQFLFYSTDGSCSKCKAYHRTKRSIARLKSMDG